MERGLGGSPTQRGSGQDGGAAGLNSRRDPELYPHPHPPTPPPRRYLEASASLGTGVDELFRRVVELVVATEGG